MAVEWGTRPYKSAWRLFSDAPDVLVPGYYYEVSDDVPFYDGWHNLGSRNWYDANWPISQGLGEDLATKQVFWDQPPPIVPLAHSTGSPACIANGESLQQGLQWDQTIAGYPPDCFVPRVTDWPFVSDLTSCSLQFFYAKLLQWIYEEKKAEIAAAWSLFIPDAVVTWHDGTDTLPNFVTAIHPDWSVAIVQGTRNGIQLATQAFQSAVPPTNFGIYGTLPLWWEASQYVNLGLQASGMNPTAPIMFTGDSYGASACANLAARYRYGNPNRRITMLTFGCPKPGSPRMISLLSRVSSLNLANDTDLVPSIPPDLQQTLPIVATLGVNSFLNWQYWYKPPNVQVMLQDGSLVTGESPILGYAQLLQLAQRILAGEPFPQVIAHPVRVYAARILRRCPNVQPPLNPELWALLTGAIFRAANGEIFAVGRNAAGRLAGEVFAEGGQILPSVPAGEVFTEGTG